MNRSNSSLQSEDLCVKMLPRRAVLRAAALTQRPEMDDVELLTIPS